MRDDFGSPGNRPSGIRRLFRIRFTVPGIRAEVRDEIRFHLESRVDDLVARGMSASAARQQAEREYGDLAASQQELVQVARRRTTHERRAEFLMSLIQDLKYATRGLVRRPALMSVTVLALTIGIGANAVMFGVVDQLLLRPPAGVTTASQVRRLYYRFNGTRGVTTNVITSYRTITALRANVPGLSDVAAYYRTSLTMGRGEDARNVDAELVSGNYFRLLGVHARLGRTFAPAEDRLPEGTHVAVLSASFWRRELGGRSDVLGQRVEVNREPFTIVGVAPDGFSDLDRQNVDIWVPISAEAGQMFGDTWYKNANHYWVQAIGRLQPTATDTLVAAQATVAYRHEQATWNAPVVDSTASVLLGPLVGAQPSGMSAEAKVSLWLMGVSVIVLLIACANVANLLIARTIDRRREIAVRLALGVSRGRLLRQLLTEAVLLACVSAAVALVAAHWAAQVVQRVLLPGIVWDGSILDARVLGFTLAATVTCIVLCGLVPAVQGVRENVVDGLKASARQVAGSRSVLRSLLLTTQAALSVLLLVGAGLFVKSLRNVSHRDVGIALDRVMLVTMNLQRAGFQPPEVRQIFATAAERIRAMPGVEQAAVVAGSAPMSGASAISAYLPGTDPAKAFPHGVPIYSVVGSDFFAATGAKITAGRTFTSAEERVPSRRVIVNDVVANDLWPHQSPVGSCLLLGSDTTCSTVVGVVQNVMQFSMLGDPFPMLYLPPSHVSFGQQDNPPSALLVRTSGDRAAVAPLIRNELQRLSPNMPYVGVKPYSDLVAPQLRSWRMGATMFTIFGIIALAIAAVGLYSVMAYWVAQREHEIGVRMALGAVRGDVVELVIKQAARPIVAGLLLGVAAAAAASHWVATMLYDTSPHDPWVYATAAGVLAIAAIVACLIPARRSASVDPASALRAD